MTVAAQLDSWARALGGEASGNSVMAPGPGHSPHDRSLSVTLDANAPGGFLVHSFAGDDPIACKDHVRARLGLPAFQPQAKMRKREHAQQPKKTYFDYHAESGAVVYQVERTDYYDGRDGAICVLDAALEVRPPFDPEVAVSACTAVLRRFGVTRVTGDRYAGLWPAARFAEHGIAFEQSARPKSDLYCDLLPLLNAKRVELLDSPRLASQLVALERRTARSGRDTVDHTPGGHDDLANVVAGVLVGLDLDRRPALVRQSDMLVHSAALLLPTICKYIVGVLAADKSGMCAVVYAAGMFTGPPLLLLDFEAGPLHGGLFSNIGSRVRALAVQCRARSSVVFVPAVLSKHAAASGLLAEEIPEDILPEELLLSAASHIAAGSVKICVPAMDKARTTPFRSALDFRASENADDPLRCATLLTIALALDQSA